jgi:hypothetical protein
VTNKSLTPLKNLSNVPFNTDVVVDATLDTLLILGGDHADFSVVPDLRFGDLGSELDREGGPLVSYFGEECNCCGLRDGEVMPAGLEMDGVVGRGGKEGPAGDDEGTEGVST